MHMLGLQASATLQMKHLHNVGILARVSLAEPLLRFLLESLSCPQGWRGFRACDFPSSS